MTKLLENEVLIDSSESEDVALNELSPDELNDIMSQFMQQMFGTAQGQMREVSPGVFEIIMDDVPGIELKYPEGALSCNCFDETATSLMQ